MKNAKGIVFKYGDNVDTDVIIPARYLNSSDPGELATHCMEDIDKEFIKKVKKGDIIVAEKNFGCGSSREHAPIAIKAAGVSCVIAETFARIFYRNAINIGLPIIECPEASKGIEAGDDRFLLGLQWHPEALAANDPIMQRPFDALVEACRKAP